MSLLREYIRELLIEWEPANDRSLMLDQEGMEKSDRENVSQYLKSLGLLEGSRILPQGMTMSEWESYKDKHKTTNKAYDKGRKTKWKITHGPGHKSAGRTIKKYKNLTLKKAKSIQNAFQGW